MSVPPEPGYVVPSRYVLTELHRKDPDDTRRTDPATAEPVDGWTACCGRPMLLSESWVAIDRREGDRICGEDCAVPDGGLAAVEDAEVTLW